MACRQVPREARDEIGAKVEHHGTNFNPCAMGIGVEGYSDHRSPGLGLIKESGDQVPQ